MLGDNAKRQYLYLTIKIVVVRNKISMNNYVAINKVSYKNKRHTCSKSSPGRTYNNVFNVLLKCLARLAYLGHFG